MTMNKKSGESDIPMVFATAVADAPESHPATAIASNDLVAAPKMNALDQHAVRSLMDQGFSRGLAEAMALNTAAFPLRIWIVDNSGSMSSTDGVRLVDHPSRKGELQYVSCTRWNELQDTVKYHAEMAALLKAPTTFRMLNNPGKTFGPPEYGIAQRGDMIQEDLQIALKCMESSPTGLTPLTEHIHAIRQEIVSLEPTLKRNGTKVAIVIATDGRPSSNTSGNPESEFVEALKSLEGLPIWVVIRLCTDDDNVVDFYNDLDTQLEYSLEVLDDWEMEAKEVHTHNKFLNYTLPLHRCREMGYHHRIFDFLDERQLSKDELKDLFTLLFGQDQVSQLPSPHSDWKGFLQGVKSIVDKEEWHWNPIKNKVQPWINVKKLDKAYGGSAWWSIK